MTIQDIKDALYYMVTKEVVPKEDTERISKNVCIVGLIGLALLVSSPLIISAIKDGPGEAFKTFTNGAYSANLNYGGSVR